ncbi:MAG: hypothetical protein HY332_19235 [Chloroflexi bacterium]|nr:hypothetical protein [Chloroflexota bacterium]
MGEENGSRPAAPIEAQLSRPGEALPLVLGDGHTASSERRSVRLTWMVNRTSI